MVKFIPIQCQNHKYSTLTPQIQERSANFFNFYKHKEDIQKTDIDYLSLHTDHGYRGLKKIFIASEFKNECPSISKHIVSMRDRCMSKLWCDDEAWGIDFSNFISKLTEGIEPQRIKIIEIHPPFKEYCDSLETFIERYKPFEEKVLKNFPSVNICIENRFNNPRTKKFGRFTLSTNEDIVKLTKLISDNNLRLKLVLDIPQLFSEHYDDKLISEGFMISEVLEPLRDIRSFIHSTHIWGKTDKGVHNADLNIYFKNDIKVKKCFLQEICKLFDDDTPRYFLPEVFSKNEEMTVEQSIESIVNDLRDPELDIRFVTPE